MTFDPVGGASRAARPQDLKARPATPASSAHVEGPSAAPRRDSVEISAEARELAALDADRAERILVVQARIKQEFYSSPEVQRDVARRLLQSGDV